MAVKLHRCPNTWLKTGGHACWKVQKALDEEGVEYEVVKHWGYPPALRRGLKRLSGQSMLPVLELEDGTVIREESADMAERVRAGKLKGSKPGVVGRILGRDR